MDEISSTPPKRSIPPPDVRARLQTFYFITAAEICRFLFPKIEVAMNLQIEVHSDKVIDRASITIHNACRPKGLQM